MPEDLLRPYFGTYCCTVFLAYFDIFLNLLPKSFYVCPVVRSFIKHDLRSVQVGLFRVYEFLALHISAINSFSNPKVLAIIAKLQKAVIRLGPFSEPPNFEGALAPLAPPHTGI